MIKVQSNGKTALYYTWSYDSVPCGEAKPLLQRALVFTVSLSLHPVGDDGLTLRAYPLLNPVFHFAASKFLIWQYWSSP